MIRLEEALGLLHRGGVDFIVVGGVAGIAHGSPRLTNDLDIVYRRRPDNIERLVATRIVATSQRNGSPGGAPRR